MGIFKHYGRVEWISEDAAKNLSQEDALRFLRDMARGRATYIEAIEEIDRVTATVKSSHSISQSKEGRYFIKE